MSFLHGASHVAILGGTNVAAAAGSSVTISHGSSAFKDLSAAAAHTAMHDSAARANAPRCHRNTRARYLNKFELWMLGQGYEFDGKRLIWLNGGAGAGKSAIMQSAVERCAQHGVILGTFFFSRADPLRNYAEILIPTLAYQVASAFPEAMAVLEPIINRNPLIFKASIHIQAYELLVRPLLYLFENGVMDNTKPVRRVFLIDGLDECSNPQEQELIIRVVTSILCKHHLPVNFMIASRPEIAITSAFQKEKQLLPLFTAISLEDDDDAQADIRQFIKDSFLDILDSHPWRMYIKMPWPSLDSIYDLVHKSSGHFIYAATVMKYIASYDEHPPRALEVVEGIEPMRTGSPFEELDALYMHILSSAKYSKRVLDILGHCYFSHCHNTYASVCRIHGVSPEDVALFLSDVQSLVSLVPNYHAELEITPKHASLRDFLSDESRAQRLYITRKAYHASLLAQYFHLVDTGPQPPTSMFSAGNDLVGLLSGLSDALVYSEDTESVQSLVTRHSPNDIWNFCVESLHMVQSLGITIRVRELSTRLLSQYMTAVRDSTALHDDTLYFQQFQMYIELLLDDISDLAGRKPQYRIIPALLFSSGPFGLVLAYRLVVSWQRRFHIDSSYCYHFHHLFSSNVGNCVVDPRAFEAIKRCPQSQRSWSVDLALTVKLVLQRLVSLSRPGPSKLLHSRASPHRQWLRQRKGLKHISLGSPKFSSTPSRRLVTVTADEHSEIEESRSSTIPYFLLSCWRRFKHISHDHLHWKVGSQRSECLVLLKTVILYLRKSDCTSEVARLARRLLPMATQWHPKAMKRARAEMDAYVQRWEESPDVLLERAQSLSINNMD